jgi:hypothetical protein
MATPTERALPITRDLPSSLYREIGRVIAAHALVEWMLVRIIYQLLGLKPVEGRIAVRQPRTTDCVDMITDLLTLNKLTVNTDMVALRKALDKCCSERDALAHGIWMKDESTGEIFLRLSSGNWQLPGTNKKAKRRIDLEGALYDFRDAKETKRLIDGVIDAVDNLRTDIVAALTASPRKSP